MSLTDIDKECTHKMNPANELIGQMPEILEIIFSNLKAKSLSRAATVNRLWNELATRELRKRGPQIIVMPVSDLHDLVETKPQVTLFFVDNSYWQANEQPMFQDFFPNHSMIVTAQNMTMDENEIIYKDLESKHDAASLLLPEYRDLKIRIAYDGESAERAWFTGDNGGDALARKFFNDLLPEDSQSKATFLLFGNEIYHSAEFLESLRHRMRKRQQEYSVWGADFNRPPVMFSGTREVHAEVEDGLFAMSITGTSLESSSITINGRWTHGDIDRQLLGFRNRLRFKRRSLGLLSAPHAYSLRAYKSLGELTKAVKRIFPRVPFIGLHGCTNCHGLNSKDNGPKSPFPEMGVFCVMVLTFD